MILLDYWLRFLTVFLVHLLNFPDVHSMTDDIVIELKAVRYSCQLGTWKMAKRVEIKTIEALNNKVRTAEANDE